VIHYIVAVFTGKRQNRVINERLSDPAYFVKKHLFGLETLKLPDVVRATFVISPSDNESRDLEVLEYVKAYDNNTGIKIDAYIKEDNYMFSYGSWNDAMEKNIGNNEHFFLIEDDYFPCSDNFYEPFVKKMEETDSAYVCQLWSDKFLRRPCAAISNGLMNIDTVRVHHKKFRECLNLKGLKEHHDLNHNQGVIAQINFLAGYQKLNFQIADISEEYGQPFLSPENRVFMYGKRVKGIVIKCEGFGEVKTEPATYLPYNRIRITGPKDQ
jgi:hypothetical protein